MASNDPLAGITLGGARGSAKVASSSSSHFDGFAAELAQQEKQRLTAAPPAPKAAAKIAPPKKPQPTGWSGLLQKAGHLGAALVHGVYDTTANVAGAINSQVAKNAGGGDIKSKPFNDAALIRANPNASKLPNEAITSKVKAETGTAPISKDLLLNAVEAKLLVGTGETAAGAEAAKGASVASNVGRAALVGGAQQAVSGVLGALESENTKGKSVKQIAGNALKQGATQGAIGAATGGGGQTVNEALHPLVGAIVRHISSGKGAEAAGGLPPEATKTRSIVEKVPTVTAGDTKQPIINQQAIQGAYGTLKAVVQHEAKGMSARDTKLLEGIEVAKGTSPEAAAARVERIAKTADNPEQFRKVSGAIRDSYQARLASDRALGRDVGEIPNYLPHIYDKGDPKTALALQRLNLTADSTPGYIKGRIIPTYAEADRLAAGAGYGQLKRANPNVLEDFYQSMDRAANDHGAAVLKKGIEEAHPGVQVGVGKVGFDRNTGQSYDQLQLPGAKRLSLPSDLAAQYNRRAPAGESSNAALRVYDKGNAVIKAAKLGGGLFHSFTTALTSLGHGIVSGHPAQALRTLADATSPKIFQLHLATLASDAAEHTDGLSTIERSHVSGVTMLPDQIRGDVGSFQKIPVLKQLHDSVFGRQIPSAKLTIFKQATKGLDSNVPADLIKMRQVASAVNKLGGINRAVEGLTPKTAKNLSRALLATDFTEGKFRTLGAALDLAHNTPENKIARQMVVGKSIVAALPGLTALTLAGKINWNDPADVARNIRDQILSPNIALGTKGAPTKTNPGGVPRVAKLPATFISELATVLTPALQHLQNPTMQPDALSGAKDYASARLAALPSLAEQLGTNKDFYGNPIYGTDSKGNKISAGKTAVNVGNEILPIPAVQTTNAVTGGSVRESILNTLGFRAANDTTSTESQRSAGVTSYFNTLDAAQKRSAAVTKKINDLASKGNFNQAARVARDYNATIAGQFAALKSKYPGYNPDKDPRYKALSVSPKTAALKTRQRNSEASTRVLQSF